MRPFPDFSKLNVLVVGDLMIDRYVYGRVDRISPEAPVPVVRKLSTEDRLGGGGNVALNLRALGARAGIAGAMGSDSDADSVSELLSANGIDGRMLLQDPKRQTTVKTRIVSQGQQLLRIDSETTDDLNEVATSQFLGLISDGLESDDYDLIVLQDYNKGVLTAEVISGVIALARRHGVMTAVDPKDRNFWAYRGVGLFKPNYREMQAQVGFTLQPTLGSLDRAAALLFERLDCREVMITLSEHGIYTHDGRHSVIHPAQARGIVDVSGAGDTVISVAASARAGGLDLQDAAVLANLAGAQVIARAGVAAVECSELERDHDRWWGEHDLS